jgi:type III restriction enzyme
LQEGWDCSFAYILTILTDPNSATGITQLVGRILRQPKAVKTKIKDLDECYIFTFKPNASTLVREIKNGLEDEGLGDIAGRLVNDEGNNGIDSLKEREIQYRPGFKKFEGKIYLPKFVIQEKESWRDLIFEVDILSQIDWERIDISEISDRTLMSKKSKELALTLGLSKEENELLIETGERIETKGTLEIDEAFLARQISEIVPNPWICYNLGDQAIKLLLKKYDKETIGSNFVFIIEELKKVLEKQKNILAEEVFKQLVDKKNLHFFLISDKGGYVLPSRIKVRSNKQLIRNDNTPIQNSLFDYVPEENINELEKSVAIYLDEQEKLLWWYRNMSRQDYHIQGWKRNKIYPDFITANKSKSTNEEYETVFVLETKGIHLKNEDTKYKQDVFSLCNEMGAKKAWRELFDEFPDHDFEFQVVFEDEWKNKINTLMR